MTTPTLARPDVPTGRTFRPSGLLLRSHWWLLIFIVVTLAGLGWLGVGAYTAPQIL